MNALSKTALVTGAGRGIGLAIALAADPTKAAEVDSAVKRVVDAWDRLDILVDNAGIIHSDVITTMTYTHMRNRGPAGVRDPADRMFLS